jgi:cytochrome c-type biogenesis protein
VITASVATHLQNTVLNGSFLLAVPIALLGGVVSFLSPCVLPLVPGYIAYVTGLSGADLEDQTRRARGRVLLGSVLFVLGFSIPLVLTGKLFAQVGSSLGAHRAVIYQVLGVVVIAFGLAFMGYLPGLQREFRLHRLPAAGIAGAPVVGFLFGVGWTPCIGPTLSAVLALSYAGSTGTQGALLTLVYCFGLGVPFVLAALFFRHALGVFSFVKRHFDVVTRTGGVLLIVVGVLLVSGLWNTLVGHLQHYISGYSTVL